MAQQLIMRRVYDSANVLIREGLVPKDLANDKQTLLDYWAQEDLAKSEAEAIAAEEELNRISSMEDKPDNDAMAIPSMMEAIDQHASLIEALAQRTSVIESAQPEEVLRLASQVQLAANAAITVESAAIVAQEKINAVGDNAQSRLDELDSRTRESIGQIADLVVGSRQQVELASSQIIADTKKQIANLVNTTTARVEALRGPKGATGNPGISTVVGAGKPTDANTLMPLIGRGAIKGDVYIDAADDSRRAYRWTGSVFEAGPSFVSTEIRDVKISSLDNSTKVTSLQMISGGGSSGGGGGENLLANRISVGGSITIGDTSNWAGISDPRSGIASVDLLAMDGANQGKTYAVELPFTWDPSDDQFTAAPELGNLLGIYTVSLSVQRSAAIAPAVYTGALPPGAQRLVLFLSVSLVPGGGGDTSTFRLGGSISYKHVAQGTAVSVKTGGLQPLWIWS